MQHPAVTDPNSSLPHKSQGGSGRKYNRRMADQLDQRPVFTIVMGCNGAGKSAWKRAHYDLLPERYYDQDSIAGGIGDWNSEEARRRTARYVAAEVDAAIEQRLSFGIESTYSGRPGREMVERLRGAGYRIEGIYLGTESATINVARIERQVLEHTGHRVDPERVPERYRYSLSNLRRTVQEFDQLEVLDNSRDDPLGIPIPVEQCCLERGEVVSRLEANKMAPWCMAWLNGVEQSRSERARLAARRQRRESHERERSGRGRCQETSDQAHPWA